MQRGIKMSAAQLQPTPSLNAPPCNFSESGAARLAPYTWTTSHIGAFERKHLYQTGVNFSRNASSFTQNDTKELLFGGAEPSRSHLMPRKVTYIYLYIYICKCQETTTSTCEPMRCRTIFVLMSDRGYSFEDTVGFSWGSLSTPHVSELRWKENGQITSRHSPSRRMAHVTSGVLTRCWFSVLWRDFSYISDKYRTPCRP